MPTRRRFLSLSFVFSTTQVTILLLGLMAIPKVPVRAIHQNEYQSCAADLSKVDIPREQVAEVCAKALHPREVSNCIVRIAQLAPIPARDGLAVCSQVRRPLELATCAIDIYSRTQDASRTSVLDYCRRSLLPVRFSECVVALSREIDFSPAKAMETCISAREWSDIQKRHALTELPHLHKV